MTQLSPNLDRLSGLKYTFSRLFPERVSLDFTLAIPTYNGGERLSSVLERLCWQLNTSDITWEIIVVDNNSTDNTAEIVRTWQNNKSLKVPLRYELERRQGAGYARHRAVQVAASSLIGFLDDDNLPNMTWVSAAYAFAQAHPQAGVIASRIQGKFEAAPPENFARISAFLALTERGSTPRLYIPESKVIPPSAGMVVRKQAWLDHVPEEPVLTGRAGKSMLTGEDTESILHIQNGGWQIWYNPHMRLHHEIPRSRLTREYLTRLFRGIGFSRYRTRMLSVQRLWLRPVMLLLYMVNDTHKILRHMLKYRRAVWKDDVAACEMTLYVSSLISPAYMLRHHLSSKTYGKFHFD